MFESPSQHLRDKYIKCLGTIMVNANFLGENGEMSISRHVSLKLQKVVYTCICHIYT
jgi:hypothetical protein